MPARMYPNSLVVRLRDADTLDVMADLGFSAAIKVTVRLASIDCPELKTEPGEAARQFAEEWVVANGASFLMTTYSSKDRYGRYLARIVSESSGRDLAADLIANGHGVLWNGRGKRPGS